MRYIILIGVVLLSGCVSQKATLTNADGQVAQCGNWGFGLIGAPIAMAAQSDCIKRAKAAGYSEFPKPAAAAANN